MGKYTEEAIKYQNNATKIISKLKSMSNKLDYIDNSVLIHKSSIDYMTPRIRTQNTNMRTEINEIISILSSNASQLVSEGKNIDRRIELEEEERKRKLLEEQEKNQNNM